MGRCSISWSTDSLAVITDSADVVPSHGGGGRGDHHALGALALSIRQLLAAAATILLRRRRRGSTPGVIDMHRPHGAVEGGDGLERRGGWGQGERWKMLRGYKSQPTTHKRAVHY